MSAESQFKIPPHERKGPPPLPRFETDEDIEDLSHEVIPQIGEDIIDLTDDALLEEDSSKINAEIETIRNKIDQLLSDTHGEYRVTPDERVDTRIKDANDFFTPHIDDVNQNTRLANKSSVDFRGLSNKNFDEHDGIEPEKFGYSNLAELSKAYGVNINPDGSIPRGGLFGKNKKRFEKLIVNQEDFRRAYDRMLSDHQIAESTKVQPIRSKDRTTAGIVLGATLAGLGGAGHQEMSRQQEFTDNLNEMSDTLKGEPSNVQAFDLENQLGEREYLQKISVESPFNIEGTGVRLNPGEKLLPKYLNEAKTLLEGQSVIIPVGEVTNLVLSVDTQGHMFGSIHGENNELIRGVSIDEDGTMHRTSKNKIIMAENAKTNVQNATFDIGYKPEPIEKGRTKLRAAENRNVQTINFDEETTSLVPKGIQAEEASDDNEFGDFYKELEGRKTATDLSEMNQKFEKMFDEPVTIKSSKGTLYEGLVNYVARQEHLDLRKNFDKSQAHELVDNLLSKAGKVEITYQGKVIKTSNIKYFLNQPGNNEMTFSLK